MSLFREFDRMQRDMFNMMREFDRAMSVVQPPLQWQQDWFDVPMLTDEQQQQQQQQQRLAGRDVSAGKHEIEEHKEQPTTTTTGAEQQQQLQPHEAGRAQGQQQQQLATRGGLDTALSPFVGREMKWLSTPAVDILAKDDRYVVKADLPAGVAKENVRVDLDTQRGVLTLSGTHSQQHEQKDEQAQWIRRERSSASFTRSLRLPNDCDISVETGKQMTAKFNNGLLELDIPRKKVTADPKLKETTQRINIE